MRSWRDNYTSRITSARPIQPPSTVDFRSIGSGQIGSDQIYGQAITEAQLADGSISSAKIGSLSASDITTGTLDASAVTVSNLNASNISTGTLSVDRISNASITGAKISGSTITGSNIAASTISASNLSVSTLSSISADMGTITAGAISADLITSGTLSANRIGTGSLNANKITSGTITATQLANTISYSGAFGVDKIGMGLSPSVNGLQILGSYVAYRGGSSAWDTTSDKRAKTNIKPLESELANIMKLKPVKFEYDKSKVKGMKTGVLRGLIAQDVKKVYPSWVVKNKNSKYLGLDTSELAVVLLRAVQEQQKQIEKLQKEVVALKKGRKKWYNIH